MIASRTLKTVQAASLVAFTLAIGSTLTAAAPSPQATVATREAGFKKMGGAMKALNEQLKSDAPAKAVMLAAARTIATEARAQSKLFPAGTGPSASVKTDALANIWTDKATFDGQFKRTIAESDKLVSVVNGGDIGAIRAQVKATGGTCSTCHKQFRADT
jgi:cytochrome c556